MVEIWFCILLKVQPLLYSTYEGQLLPPGQPAMEMTMLILLSVPMSVQITSTPRAPEKNWDFKWKITEFILSTMNFTL